MIYEHETNYYAEWFDSENMPREQFLGKNIPEVMTEAHKINQEHDCNLFIIEEKIERRVFMQVRKRG